jgi:riboflavin kinase/FMN adenylyltransferase
MKESVNKMKEIFSNHPPKLEQIPQDEVVLVLGYFDGVHKGHQEVINRGKKIADEKNLKLALMTFNHHPSIVFNKLTYETTKMLNTTKQKAKIMENLGVDYYYVMNFTSNFSKIKPQNFVDTYIVGFKAKVVVTGFDYTFGPKSIASVKHFPLYSKNRFEVVTVPEFVLDGEKVSSTRIRKLLDDGKMEEVNHLLGYTYQTSGVVVHGEKRGRILGYPTANIDVPETIRLSKVGVYVTRVTVAGKVYRGMTSIGYNDTFGDNRGLTVESYILDFSEDIYGEEITVEWVHYIRDMVKFNSVDELIAQLKADYDYTRAFEMEDI